MMSVAQREEQAEMHLATGTDGASVLRQIAAERLAAHRRRRAAPLGAEVAGRVKAGRVKAEREAGAVTGGAEAATVADSARVREAVAARYLQSQSYREFLAIESQRALEKAQAEAEVAARSARAVAAAQQQLLEEIAQWNQPLEDTAGLRVVEPRGNGRLAAGAPVQLQVKMHQEFAAAGVAAPAAGSGQPSARGAEELYDLAELEEEIEFRRAPEFDDLVLETQTIQANIIEFPRQLVASRKVRPRLAEGPLAEETVPEPQLRIFEVEPEQVAVEPETAAVPDAPEWQSLRLGSDMAAQAESRGAAVYATASAHAVYAARVSRRLLCAAGDAAVLAINVGISAAIAEKVAGPALMHAPWLQTAGAAAGALAVFGVLYRQLFFTLNEATPGMRMMRIAFCTFDEDSPKRKFIRRRIIATALAACPLGMGLLWTVLDSDRLGWHDRMSRMYPREY